MELRVNKSEVDVGILLYTGLFDYKDGIIVDAIGEQYVFHYTANGEEIATAVEAHTELAGDYSSVYYEMMGNASKEISAAIEHLLDSTAQQYRYDDIKSVRSYTGFDNKFRAECIKIAVWGAQCWEAADVLEAEVMAGTRTMPTKDEVLALMPVLDMGV